jgi:hypothetical protein
MMCEKEERGEKEKRMKSRATLSERGLRGKRWFLLVSKV